jgi:hypothetical protein
MNGASSRAMCLYTRSASLTDWWRVAARQVTNIVSEFYAEVRRLNHAGDCLTDASNSRRQRTGAFKAALAQKYGNLNRCC